MDTSRVTEVVPRFADEFNEKFAGVVREQRGEVRFGHLGPIHGAIYLQRLWRSFYGFDNSIADGTMLRAVRQALGRPPQ